VIVTEFVAFVAQFDEFKHTYTYMHVNTHSRTYLRTHTWTYIPRVQNIAHTDFRFSLTR